MQQHKMFKKILIANRGEIACRVIDTARRLGIKTVAVYSDFDEHSRHVEMADQAVHIGAAPAVDSYLDIQAVIDAAITTGAQGIHPGYGFLAENATFAQACEDANLTFIGPPVSAIETMGSKQASKQLMESAAVPLIPGYHGSDESDPTLAAAAADIGYPLMIKASAGGGGKGMRRVDTAEDFTGHLAAARREAKAAFGDDRILLEKMLVNARHVEIQVFADNHGNVVHLFERDCSLQRRHQKVIEEAPAFGLSAETRAAMGHAAVAAAKAVGYRGAGTVEFIMDTEQNFFFMEMNTRLQVEHPVTEMVTGVDLVEWQLLVASGGSIPLQQDELSTNGWAVEARLYAENPAKRFLPATGTLHTLGFPATSATGSAEAADLRIETGVRQGDSIGIYYDPMIAKVVAWGPDRTSAIARLHRALANTHISGLVTNLAFLQQLLLNDAFVAGTAHTQYLDANLDNLLDELPKLDSSLIALAALAQYQQLAAANAEPNSPWCTSGGWRSMTAERLRIALAAGSDRYVVELERYRVNQGVRFAVAVNGAAPHLFELFAAPEGQLHFRTNGVSSRASYSCSKDLLSLFTDGHTYSLKIEPDYQHPGSGGAGPGGMTAPMPGNVVAVLVQVGDRVQQGDTLVVIEAMKMEHKIVADKAGTVTQLPVGVGDAVEENLQLAVIDG